MSPIGLRELHYRMSMFYSVAFTKMDSNQRIKANKMMMIWMTKRCLFVFHLSTKTQLQMTFLQKSAKMILNLLEIFLKNRILPLRTLNDILNINIMKK